MSDAKKTCCSHRADQFDRKKLQVHSKVLSLSSKVFSALLSARFKEGAQLRSTSVIEIPLPDDEAEFMEPILRALHYRSNETPDDMSAGTLFEIAKLVDKYDCVAAMKHVSRCWLHRHLPPYENDAKASDLRMLVAASFFFKDGEICKDICFDYIVKSKSRIAPPPGLPMPDALERIYSKYPHHSVDVYLIKRRGLLTSG